MNPNKYSKNNALQYNFALRMLSKISFKQQSRVLDIGCGDGVITSEIAKIANHGCVLGTDISHNMVEYASKKYSNINNLRFLQMDATNNFFRNQFDIITSFNCLHWVEDQQNVLNKISNAAVNGAQIVILLSHKKSLYHLVLDEICTSDKWKPYFLNFLSPRYFFTIEVYNQMLIESGLDVISISEEEMSHQFKSKEELKNFFSAAGSQIKQVPLDKKDAFLNDFADRFIEKANQDDCTISVSFWCLQILALKPNIHRYEKYNAMNI